MRLLQQHGVRKFQTIYSEEMTLKIGIKKEMTLKIGIKKEK